MKSLTSNVFLFATLMLASLALASCSGGPAVQEVNVVEDPSSSESVCAVDADCAEGLICQDAACVESIVPEDPQPEPEVEPETEPEPEPEPFACSSNDDCASNKCSAETGTCVSSCPLGTIWKTPVGESTGACEELSFKVPVPPPPPPPVDQWM